MNILSREWGGAGGGISASVRGLSVGLGLTEKRIAPDGLVKRARGASTIQGWLARSPCRAIHGPSGAVPPFRRAMVMCGANLRVSGGRPARRHAISTRPCKRRSASLSPMPAHRVCARPLRSKWPTPASESGKGGQSTLASEATRSSAIRASTSPTKRSVTCNWSSSCQRAPSSASIRSISMSRIGGGGRIATKRR